MDCPAVCPDRLGPACDQQSADAWRPGSVLSRQHEADFTCGLRAPGSTAVSTHPGTVLALGWAEGASGKEAGMQVWEHGFPQVQAVQEGPA